MKKMFSLLAGLSLLFGLASTAFAVADEITPSDVENVVAEAGDGVVILSWDAAIDNEGVSGYFVYSGLASVSAEDEEYDFGAQDVGDVLSAEVSGLENGTTYYFAVTAYDAADNESPSYSFEVDATPEEGAGIEADDEAPTVVTAEAVSMVEVDVEFSEEVALPETNPEQAFTVENDETFELLEVLDAVILADEDVEEGKEGMVVRLTTEEQTKDADYILTATIDVTDLVENPIISGTSDTATFVGSEEAPVDADIEEPEVTGAEYMDSTNILINFSETIVLSLTPAEDFEVSVKGSAGADALEVTEVVLGENTETGDEDGSVILTVSEMADGETYIVSVDGVTDEEGNDLSSDADSAEFTVGEETGAEGEGEGEGEGEEEEEEDVLEDATDLMAEAIKTIVTEAVVCDEEGEKGDEVADCVASDEVVDWKVMLDWVLPEDAASTLQTLYFSDDGSEFATTETLALDSEEFEYMNSMLEEGEDYWFKLTQSDDEGNETDGVLVKLNLSDTGPGVAGLILVSLGLGHFASKKKKQ
jgi:hypothetical protein